MPLADRRNDFQADPNAATARRLTEELFDAWSDGDIGRDTLRQDLINIATGLTEGLSDLGHPVTVKIV